MNFKSTPDGFLAFLIRKLLITTGVDSPRLKILIERYIRLNQSTNEYKKHHGRVNIYNEIFKKGKMSIKGFFRTLVILRYSKVKITITVTNHLGREITVVDEIMLPEKGFEEDGEDETDSEPTAKPRPSHLDLVDEDGKMIYGR